MPTFDDSYSYLFAESLCIIHTDFSRALDFLLQVAMSGCLCNDNPVFTCIYSALDFTMKKDRLWLNSNQILVHQDHYQFFLTLGHKENQCRPFAKGLFLCEQGETP